VAGKTVRASWLLRVGLVGAAATAALAVGSPAWANSTININPGNVSTTAAAYHNKNCDANQGGSFAGKDVWVFVLPGKHDTGGDFVSVTANFGTNGSVTITTAADPHNFANGGPATAKAWIVTPAGWTLVGASAVITGTASFFNLTHTCPAGGSSTPTPTPSSSISGSPSSSPSTPPSHDGSTPPPSGSRTPGGPDGGTPSGGAPTGGGGGQPAGSLLWGLGALAVAAGGGVTLVLVRRRRDNA
jgi:hypothetical protein